MNPDLKKYTEANREAWNEVMPMHQKAARERWDRAFMEPGYVCLEADEAALLRKVGIEGKAAAHLCCNNGIELLSLKNLGASECVGFDISDLAIQEARERARLCRIDCHYVRSDVYDIVPEYDKRFDLVYFTPGALGWLPDLKLLFARAKSLLKDQGLIFIHEIHPFSELLPFDESSREQSREELLRIVEPYFKVEPFVDYGDLDYVGGTKYASDKPQYWFLHKISDLIMALIENGFVLDHFSEHEQDISGGHKRIEELKAGLPLSYFLIAKRV